MYNNDMSAGGYRPDLNSLINQPQKPVVQEVSNPPPVQEKPQEHIQQVPKERGYTVENVQRQQPSAEIRREVPAARQMDRRKDEEQVHKEKSDRYAKRNASKSRSRSRSKSPSRVPPVEVKEPEVPKESKEDKLKSAKERYLQRKLQSAAAAATADANQPPPQN